MNGSPWSPSRSGTAGHRAARILIAIMGLCGGTLQALDVEGSLFTRAGPGFPPAGVPAETVPGWAGEMQASARVTGEAGPGSLALQGRFLRDFASGGDDLLVEEAWAAWKPLPVLAVKLGRQRIGHGCGIAWSVVDDLDPKPMPFDTHTPREGLDAIRFSADFSPVSIPVQVSAETYVPAGLPGAVAEDIRAAQGAPQLHDLGAAAQVSAFLGGVEVGAAGSTQGLERSPPVTLGGWATVDLAGFVLGAEGAWRDRRAQFLANCNRRMGDFAAIAEARWIPVDSQVWLFGQLSWSREDLGASVAGLASLEERSGLVDFSVSYNATESLMITTGATAYERPDLIPEIGPLPWRVALTLSAEYFF